MRVLTIEPLYYILNNEYRHSRINYVKPGERHEEKERKILA